jgi:hypothetical protein
VSGAGTAPSVALLSRRQLLLDPRDHRFSARSPFASRTRWPGAARARIHALSRPPPPDTARCRPARWRRPGSCW